MAERSWGSSLELLGSKTNTKQRYNKKSEIDGKKIGIKCSCVSRLPNEQQWNYDQLNDLILKHHLLIVNTTPLGTIPNINECPNIPYQYITEKHLLVDLVYNPEETLFLKKGRKNLANILNGKSMLIHQAEEAWKIWNS